jgi:hypothetical protein
MMLFAVHFTTLEIKPFTKPLPVTTTVRSALPAIADVGEIEKMPKLWTIKGNSFDSGRVEEKAPLSTFWTDSIAVTALRNNASGMTAVSSVSFAKRVARAVSMPFCANLTTLEPLKLAPFTVTVRSGLPDVALLGVTALITGTVDD